MIRKDAKIYNKIASEVFRSTLYLKAIYMFTVIYESLVLNHNIVGM